MAHANANEQTDYRRTRWWVSLQRIGFSRGAWWRPSDRLHRLKKENANWEIGVPEITVLTLVQGGEQGSGFINELCFLLQSFGGHADLLFGFFPML